MLKTFTKLFFCAFCLLSLNLGNAQSLPLTFEDGSLTYSIFGFGGVDPAAIIGNPDATGANTSAMVAQVNKNEGSEVWAGASLPLVSIIDLNNGSMFEVKVWSPRVNVPIQLKFEDTTSPPDANGNPSIITEVIVNTTTSNAWEVLTFDMSTHPGYDVGNMYDQVVIFPDFGNVGVAGGESFYFDDFQGEGTGAMGQSLPLTFDEAGIAYSLIGFGGVDPAAIIANPDVSGVNTSATVVQINKTEGSEVWAGVSMPLVEVISFAGSTIVEFKFWSPRADIPVLIKIEDTTSPPNGDGNPSIFVEVQTMTTAANGWEILMVDMASSGDFDINNNYDQIIVFPDFGNVGVMGGESFYVDDIQIRGSVAISETELAKVQMNAFPNPVNNVLNVSFDIPVTGQVTLTLVDVLGRIAQHNVLGNINAGLYTEQLPVDRITGGTYVLLLRLDGQLIKTQNIVVR